MFAPLLKRGHGDPSTELKGQARGRTIWLDPRLPDVGKTLLHELLHVRHPAWSERKVQVETRRRWAKMSWKEKATLYKMLGAARLEGDKSC